MRSLYLRLSVTDRCDLRCRYCRPEQSPRGDWGDALPLDDLARLVRAIRREIPIHKIRLTGGEPLLRGGIVELVSYLRQTLPDTELCLTTNAGRLARFAEPLRAAGLDRVNVSLDTVDPGRFRTLTRGGELAPVLEGLAAVGAAGFPRLRMNAVLMRSTNLPEIHELARMAVRHGAELRFIELMPIGEASNLPADEHVPAEEALAALTSRFADLGPLPGSGTAWRRLIDVDGAQLTVGFIAPVSAPFCGACDRLRLDSRGRLFSCLRHAVGRELAPPLHAGDDAELGQRIRALLRSKGTPEDEWPARVMSAIGG